jgi:cytochrome c biogenesis protein CcdA
MTASDTARSRRSARIGTILSIAAVLLVAIAGYFGFRVATGLDISSETSAGLVALAAVTGFAAFFSPCSFALLLGLLAGSNTAAAGGRSRSEGVRTALAMGLGAGIFLLTIGLLVGLVGEGIAQSVAFSTNGGRVLRGTAAVFLVVAGSVQLGWIQIPFWRLARFAQPIDRMRVAADQSHRRSAQVLYGFGFVLAGFG